MIDDFTIDLHVEYFDCEKFRKMEGAVKINLKLDGDILYTEQANLTTGAVNEDNEVSGLCNKSREIHVIDRGYVDW